MSWPAPAALAGAPREFSTPVIVMIACLCLCARRARTRAREGRRVAPWRIVSFALGVLLVAVVELGPPARYARSPTR